MPYHKAAPHLVLLAFLQRIVNGGGRIERKFAVGTGRPDLVVDFGGQQDVLELKLLRGSYTQAEGIEQVAAYAQRLRRPVGYPILFDMRSTTPWEARGTFETHHHQGMAITMPHA